MLFIGNTTLFANGHTESALETLTLQSVPDKHHGQVTSTKKLSNSD